MAKSKPKNLVDLVCEALDYRATEWENDEPIGGGDLVEFFGDWRMRVKHFLRRDERELNGMRLSRRELATVLASLRNLQLDLMQPEFKNGFKHQEHFAGGIEPMNIKAIDKLCERINQ